MPHGFNYVELRTHYSHLGADKEFYRSLFGWGLDTLAGGANPYIAFDADDGIGGGMTLCGADEKPTWLAYVRVDDCVRATEMAVALGGTIVRPTASIPYKGAFSIIADPTGAQIGLWQAFAPDLAKGGTDAKPNESSKL